MAEFEDIKSKMNLRNIKSSYIIKRIFSFLYEKQKLRMIVNNKELQKICLVDIKDYKLIFGKYKIAERNGKGREYTIKENNLIFEGLYLNGVRNGKGKEYFNNGNLKFDGDYLNGVRHGKGKEYYDNGKLKYEGDYLKGKRNGKGKEFNDKGHLDFEGDYLKGKNILIMLI